jgi:serine/threonine protein kinase
VHLALHKLTRKLVAVKSMKLNMLFENAEEKTLCFKRIFNEIEILKMLKHENHIKLFETVLTDSHMCLIMELCPGGNLLSYIKKRRKLSET